MPPKTPKAPLLNVSNDPSSDSRSALFPNTPSSRGSYSRRQSFLTEDGTARSSYTPIGIMAHTGDITADAQEDYALDNDSDMFVGQADDETLQTPSLGSPSHSTGMLQRAASVDLTNFDDTPAVYSADGQPLSWSGMEWTQRLRYLSYYFPVSVWLPKYDRALLVDDIIAGLSIGAMMVPQSMAYAGILGLPPIYGLITGLFPQIIYFLLGSSPILTCGAEATTSILLADTIENLANIVEARNKGTDMLPLMQEAASAITLLAGIFTLLLGLFRLGFVDGVFSRPVLSGFVCAIGALLIVDQTPKVLGVPPCGDCEDLTHLKLGYLLKAVFVDWDINWRTALVGCSCVIFLFVFQYLKHRDPDSKLLSRTPHIFLMVAAATGFSYALDLQSYGVTVLGTQKGGFPTPSFPAIPSQMFSQYLTAAITLSVLGFVETQLVNKTVNPSGSTISPNRELVALGAMHVTNAVFGGYAAFGSLTRTKVAQRAGSRSQVSSLVAGAMILTAMLALMPLFAYMPVAVTAGIIWFVATSLLETHDLFFTYRMGQWVDLALHVSMVLVTFFLGVDSGLFFAFACCLLLVVRSQHKPAVRLLGRAAAPALSAVATDASGSARLRGVEMLGGEGDHAGDGYYELEASSNLAGEAAFEGILIYQIDGPLFFCNSEGLKDRTRRIELQGSVVSHPSAPVMPLALRCIIFDMTAVTSVDSTAAQVLLEIVDDYKKRSVRVIFVKLRKTLQPSLENSGVLDALGISNVMLSIDAAIESVESATEEAPLLGRV